jgi:hypothetical protein
LAKLASSSPTRVRAWIRHPEWRLRITPPWDVEEVKKWRAAVLRPDLSLSPGAQSTSEPMSRKAEVDLLWRARRAEREKLNIDIESGRLHSVIDCHARRLRQVLDLRRALLALPRGLAAACAGKSSDEIEAILAAALAAACNSFAQAVASDPQPRATSEEPRP